MRFNVQVLFSLIMVGVLAMHMAVLCRTLAKRKDPVPAFVTLASAFLVPLYGLLIGVFIEIGYFHATGVRLVGPLFLLVTYLAP